MIKKVPSQKNQPSGKLPSNGVNKAQEAQSPAVQD